MGRPPHSDHPIHVKVMRCELGYIGQILGHSQEILWECPPRSDGRDDPQGGAHHQPHGTSRDARACARREMSRGKAEGLYR